MHRPVTVVMLLAALVLLGVVATVRLPVQLMPSGFDPPFLMVFVPYPGANPAEVEEEIVRPLEDQLLTVGGIAEMNCQASGDSGRCWVQFLQSVDMDEVYNEVADRIERLEATEWPDDVERVRIRRFNPTDDAPLKLSLAIPQTTDDPYWVLVRRVVQPLERTPGVAQVDLEGIEQRQITIEPDRQRLDAHRISLWALYRALAASDFALSSGDVDEAGRRLLVRSIARYRSIDEIERTPIRADGLRLGDVARVRYAPPPAERGSRLDGRPTAIIEIFKESTANTIAVTSAALRELERIYASDPVLAASGGFQVLFDQGEVIRDSIRQLRDAGLIGALLAIVVLYVFLRRIRVTVLITLAIPVSMMAALIVMHFAGQSIDVVSLMGLLICTGLLVDNAVVVTENIDRYRREGRSVREAALLGATEIGLALTMATTTTVVVFLPMILMSEEGMMRFFLLKLSIPVVVAILASLVVALLFVPLAAARLVRPIDAAAAPSRSWRDLPERVYRSLIEPLQRLYLRVLRWALDHRLAAVVLVLATLAASVVPMRATEVSIQGRHQVGGRQIRFWFNLPNSYGLAEADAWFRRVEEAIDPLRDRAGVKHVQTRFWHNRGMVRVILRDTDETDITVEEATEILQRALPTAPGVQRYVNWQRGSGQDASVTVELYGEDTAELATLAEEAERRLRSLAGVLSVEPDLENALEEVRVRIHRDLALRYGVAADVVAGTIATALRGRRLPRYREGEREIDVLLQFPLAERSGVRRLASLDLPGRDGRRIPLEAIADITIARGYGDIRRRDRRTVLGVQINTTFSSLRDLRARIASTMDAMELPRDVSWSFGSRRRWEQQDFGNMLFGLGMAIVFIYLIMGFLFESFSLPLSVLPSIPLSWIGVFWLLWMTSSKLDMMAAIGLILLAGLVVNNGIVLVDLVNRLRWSGCGRTEAVLEAGRLRFRPILMTALTTVTGMIPMALGKANFVGIPYAGLGRTFIGGLLSSTVLTLVVVPVFYTLLDDAGRILLDAIRPVRRARAAAGGGHLR